MLTSREREALVWVRNALDPAHPEAMPDWLKFDISHWAAPSGCGTACCIGGSMDMRLKGLIQPELNPDWWLIVYNDDMGFRAREMVDQGHPGLHNLFFNFVGDATPEMAVAAIDAYLDGAEHPWRGL